MSVFTNRIMCTPTGLCIIMYVMKYVHCTIATIALYKFTPYSRALLCSIAGNINLNGDNNSGRGLSSIVPPPPKIFCIIIIILLLQIR